ncbi:MAG: hypothetical protein WCP20_07930 [Desulfuromonadales bacterium]
MAKKPVGISVKNEKMPSTVPTGEPMNTDSFIAGCNERGSEGKGTRYPKTAEACQAVPPFTTKGLACLAGLLSDQHTASGGVQKPEKTPDKSKSWAMGFLSQFNPQGYCKIERPDFLFDFARQVVDGEPYYEPAIKL